MMVSLSHWGVFKIPSDEKQPAPRRSTPMDFFPSRQDKPNPYNYDAKYLHEFY